MKRIIVGYDGSDIAARAVVEAAVLARATGAAIDIVTVVNEDRLRQGMITADAQERLKQRAAAQAERLLTTDEWGLADRLEGVATKVEILPGAPAERLVRHAETIDADLIVVGNRRVQGLNRILGSVAIAVLRHAHCSVYVAHTT